MLGGNTRKRLCFIGVPVAALATCAYMAIRSTTRVAVWSTEASIAAALDRQAREVAATPEPTASWRAIAGAEYIALMAAISKSSSLDCADVDPKSGMIVDPWGRPYLIAVRKSETRAAEYLVWSRGPDHISGTSDDVVWPREISLPQELVGESK